MFLSPHYANAAAHYPTKALNTQTQRHSDLLGSKDGLLDWAGKSEIVYGIWIRTP